MLRLRSYDSGGERADRGVIEIDHPFLSMREELTKRLKLVVRNGTERLCVHVGSGLKRLWNCLRIILKETSKIKELRCLCSIVFRQRVA